MVETEYTFLKKYIKFKLNLQPIVNCVSSGEKQCSVVKKKNKEIHLLFHRLSSMMIVLLG